MRKTDALRAMIVATLPELAASPERLAMWIERGAGRSTLTRDQHFGLSYRLNVLVKEMTSDAALLFFAIFRWARVHQPDLMQPGKDGFAWDCDFLDNAAVDLLVTMDVTEDVSVVPQVDGSHHLDYLEEPDPLMDDHLGPLFEGAHLTPVPPLDAVSLAGEGVVVESDG